MPEVTVGIYARERFSPFGRCIATLIRNTQLPFKLLVIDCNMPDRYRQQVDRAVSGVDDAEIVKLDHYVLPNQSRNLVLEKSKTDYVCLLESDVMVDKDALQYMLQTAKATRAAVVRPTIYQRRGVVHFDRFLGAFRGSDVDTGAKGSINGATELTEYEPGSHPRPVLWTEFHCNLIHRPSVQGVFPLDQDLSEPEHIDYSLRLRAAGASIVYEPKAVVRLHSPPPVEEDERDFFRFRWDLEKARASHRRFRERWNVEYAGLEDWIATVPARETWLSYAKLRWSIYIRALAAKRSRLR